MTIRPTEFQRAVFLDIQTNEVDQPRSNHTQTVRAANLACTSITYIRMVADNGMLVEEFTMQNAAEIDLLRQFWQTVQPHDVFVGRQISGRLAFIRRQSWMVGLIPSPGIDLRAIYQHSTLDTGCLRSSGGDARYRSAEALADLLGLAGNRTKPKNGGVNRSSLPSDMSRHR